MAKTPAYLIKCSIDFKKIYTIERKNTQKQYFCLPVQKNILANPFFFLGCATSFLVKNYKGTMYFLRLDWTFFCKMMIQEEAVCEDDD